MSIRVTCLETVLLIAALTCVGCGESSGTPQGAGGQAATGGSAGEAGGAGAGATGSGGAGTAGAGGTAAGGASGGGGANTSPQVSSELQNKYDFALVFDSDFSKAANLESGALWRRETMAKSHNSAQHKQAEGRRHAAWYDQHLEKTAFLRDGTLVQAGFVADASLAGFKSRDSGSAPRNHAYVDPDPRDAPKGTVNFADFELHTSWFDTFALKWSQGQSVPVQTSDKLLPAGQYTGAPGTTDTPSPNRTFLPGSYFEIEVSFQGMKALAHRSSFWLMPATAENHAYDSDPANGLEIDIYEHELVLDGDPLQAENEILLMKSIGGSTSPPVTKNTLRPDGSTAMRVSGINSGWHKIGLLWTKDELIWLVDGKELVRDPQLVPQVPMYLLLTREANTGAVDPSNASAQELKSMGEVIPLDPGLFGRNVATPGNRALVKAGSDEVRVRYVRAWQATTK